MATKVKGLDKLLAQIGRLPQTVRAEVGQALAESAEDLVGAIKRAVPKRSGDLERSIQWTFGGEEPTFRATGVIKSQAPSERTAALGKMGLSISILAGDDKAYYARWVEFGTAYAPAGRFKDAKGKTRTNSQPHHATPAQPYFYPTIRAHKSQIKARVVRAGRAAAKLIASSGGSNLALAA